MTSDFQEMMLRHFRSYLRRSQLHGTYLAVNLNFIIRQWLANPAFQEHNSLEELEIHEMVALIEFIETSIRSTWTKKSQKTRARSKKYKEKRALKNAQQSFKF